MTDMLYDDEDVVGYYDVSGDDDDYDDIGYEPMEVGRRRGRARKRLRRFGLALAGPIGMVAAARGRRRSAKAARQTTSAYRATAGLQLASRGVPVTEGRNLLASDQRQQDVGGSITLAAAGGTGTLTIAVAKPFQARKMIISADVLLADITITSPPSVGMAPQGASQGARAAAAFGAGVQENAIMWDPAFPGLDITIPLANSNAAQQVVTVTIFGYSSL